MSNPRTTLRPPRHGRATTPAVKESRPIYDLDNEHAVLGCLIGDRELRGKYIGQVIAGDFFAEENADFFRLIHDRHEQGESLSLEALQKVGVSFDLLSDCVERGVIPTFTAYLRLLKRDSARRRRLEELEAESRKVREDPEFVSGGTGGLVARDAKDLVADSELTEPPVLVNGLIHRGGMLLLGAASKSFKSWALIDLGLAIANGASWWGAACSRGSVLYADFELKPFFWRKRATEIAQARGLALDGIRVLNCRGHEAGVALRAIDREAKLQAFDLIIIDPLYSFLAGRDENSAGDVGAILRELGAVAESTGAALAISHHFAKGNAAGKDSQDRFSGSGVFARFPDALLTMTRHEEDGAFVIDSTIRNFAPMSPWVMRWQHPLMERDGALDPAKLKKAAGTFESKYSVEQLIEVLGSELLSFGNLVTFTKATFGMSKATVDRLLKQGMDAGRIEKTNLLYRAVSRVSRP